MRRPSLRWVVRFGALGALVALGLFGLLQVGSARWGLRTHFIVLDVAGAFWPSSFWLLATKGVEYTLQGWTIVAMSIAANVVLYAAIGALISAFRRKPPAVGPSLREKGAIAALLVPFIAWKVYKFTLLDRFGPFSWDALRPLLLFSAAFLGGVCLLLWLHGRRGAAGP